MVCPNCHSDKVIQVQDQFFCINCGQSVPDSAVKKSAKIEAKIAVQENGLPEGVKVLPVNGKPVPEVTKPAAGPSGAAKPKTVKLDIAPPAAQAEPAGIVKQRKRMGGAELAEVTPAQAKRKAGRPKAGRLDVPATPATPAPAAAAKAEPSAPEPAPDLKPAKPIITLPDAPPEPKPAPAAKPAPALPPAPKIHTHAAKRTRSLSDIAPRRKPSQPRRERPEESHPEPEAAPKPAVHAQAAPKVKTRHHVSKVEVPPLHFGAVTRASLRARIHPGYFGLSAAAACVLALAAAYGAWLYFSGGLPRLASAVVHAGSLSIAEAAVLALLYYIGRSVSQSAITFGVMREADGRPVSLARQINVGVNTFPRRLGLDISCATLAIGLLCGAGALLLVGGSTWPVSQELQVAALFSAFLIIMYLLTALGITRGLAGVAVTVTPEEPLEAAKLGWQLFSHRFELLGLRFLAMALELVLAVPVLAAAVALLAAAPDGLHAPAALAVGLLAMLAGALLGAGTAGWWASLYRQLVLADRPDKSASLLSSHQPTTAKPADLTLVVALASFLIAVALALPWLKTG